MIDGIFVADATVHGFNFTAGNFRAPFMPEVVRMLYHFGFDVLHPVGDRRYRLSFDEFQDAFTLQPALMERVLFGESPIDVACYHGVPMYGLFGDGSSPIHVGEAIAARLPHRMYVYADISTTHPDPLGWIDAVAARPGVVGLKFYPVDMVEGRIVQIRLDDATGVWPLIDRARARGLRTIAVHKAVPLGPMTRDLYDVRDLAPVIAAFPDMRFEIVHGGFAFAEETAALLAAHDNVWINLETTPCLCINQLDAFADMLEPLLATGCHDRIMFATGATGMHPRPFVEAFRQIEMPRNRVRLTEAMKVGILGANFARLHAIDVAATLARCANDEYGTDALTHEPWSLFRERAAA